VLIASESGLIAKQPTLISLESRIDYFGAYLIKFGDQVLVIHRC
jgi:hypothetical protein